MWKRTTITLAVLAVVAALLGTYTAGYLLLPDTYYWCNGHLLHASKYEEYREWLTKARIEAIERDYSQQWMPTAFLPAARFEAWLRGIEVQPTWSAEDR